LCTPPVNVGTKRIFNGSRDIYYFQQAQLLLTTIRALTILYYFDTFYPTFEPEAALEDSTQLAELTIVQLKVEEEECLAELKQAWTRDCILDVEDNIDKDDEPTTT
jgi:hypothetical protein